MRFFRALLLAGVPKHVDVADRCADACLKQREAKKDPVPAKVVVAEATPLVVVVAK